MIRDDIKDIKVKTAPAGIEKAKERSEKPARGKDIFCEHCKKIGYPITACYALHSERQQRDHERKAKFDRKEKKALNSNAYGNLWIYATWLKA